MLSLGVLGRPHGVAGDLLFRPHDPASDALATVSQVTVVKDGRARPFDVAAARPADKGWIVRLAGIDDRDAAAALTLAEVRVRRGDLPPLSSGEYYVEDVLGCTVEDEAGRTLGTVQGLFWNGAHDVATVVDAGGVERLVPIVPSFVLSVDAAGRKVRVHWSDDE